MAYRVTFRLMGLASWPQLPPLDVKIVMIILSRQESLFWEGHTAGQALFQAECACSTVLVQDMGQEEVLAKAEGHCSHDLWTLWSPRCHCYLNDNIATKFASPWRRLCALCSTSRSGLTQRTCSAQRAAPCCRC